MPSHDHWSGIADARGYLGYFRSRSNMYYDANKGPSSILGRNSVSGCFEVVEAKLRSEGNADNNETEYIVGLKANKLMNSQGANYAHENRPPYYALYFIMKIQA